MYHGDTHLDNFMMTFDGKQNIRFRVGRCYRFDSRDDVASLYEIISVLEIMKDITINNNIFKFPKKAY
jgi:hypothetical protein